jgi:hypothetical protein
MKIFCAGRVFSLNQLQKSKEAVIVFDLISCRLLTFPPLFPSPIPYFCPSLFKAIGHCQHFGSSFTLGRPPSHPLGNLVNHDQTSQNCNPCLTTHIRCPCPVKRLEIKMFKIIVHAGKRRSKWASVPISTPTPLLPPDINRVCRTGRTRLPKTPQVKSHGMAKK